MKIIISAIILIFITNCTGNKVSNYHGVKNLEDKYDKIILSTYQYSETIKDDLTKKKIYNFFSPYSNSSRSILDIFFINKYKNKYKIHSKKIF